MKDMNKFLNNRILIAVLAVFTGIKFIISYVLLRISTGENDWLMILLGVNFFILSPVFATDKRKGNSSLFAVICHIIVYVLILIWINFVTRKIFMYVYTLAEILAVLCFVVSVIKENRPKKEKKRISEKTANGGVS